jgi:hypothetical protein
VTTGAFPVLNVSLGAVSNDTVRAISVPASMAWPPVSTAGRVDAHSVRSNVCWLSGGHSLPVFRTDGRVDALLSILMVLLGYVPPCPSPDLTAGGCPSLEGIGFMQPSCSSFDVLGCCLERLTTSVVESSPYISLYVSKASDITFRDLASLFHLPLRVLFVPQVRAYVVLITIVMSGISRRGCTVGGRTLS